MRKEKVLRKFLEEAECRVSWVRKTVALNRIANGVDPIPPGAPYTEEEWRKLRLDALDQGFKSILSLYSPSSFIWLDALKITGPLSPK